MLAKDCVTLEDSHSFRAGVLERNVSHMVGCAGDINGKRARGGCGCASSRSEQAKSGDAS